TSERLPESVCSEDYQDSTGHQVVWRLYGTFANGRECAIADQTARDDAILLYEAITGWRIERHQRGTGSLTGLYAAHTAEALELVREVAQCEHIRDIAEWKDAYPRLVAAARRIIREV